MTRPLRGINDEMTNDHARSASSTGASPGSSAHRVIPSSKKHRIAVLFS
jgi:hypothetical protein